MTCWRASVLATMCEWISLVTTSAGPPAMLFDLDGTLIGSVYQHVLAWQEALLAFGMDLSVWKIHRRIGMSRRDVRHGPAA